MVMGIIFFVYQENKYLNLMKYRLSVLSSLSIPFDKLKHLYIIQFFKKGLWLLLIGILEVIGYLFVVKGNYDTVLLSVVYVVVVLVVVLGYMLLTMAKYHYKNIATIFKDDKS